MSDRRRGVLPPGEAIGQEVGDALPLYINCDLGSNQVGEKGSKGLSRGDWPLLKEIGLGTNVLTKPGTSWGRREWAISPRPGGGGSRKLL